MLKELRLRHELTQQEVADAIGRSPNFVLKAEQLTFPAAPPALVEYYSKLDKSYTADYLRSWYTAEQTSTREAWLTDWVPAHKPFEDLRTAWVNLDTGLAPTEYRLSAGLCLPAAVVFQLGRSSSSSSSTPTVVLTAMDQLIDYVESGRYFNASTDDAPSEPSRVLAGLLAIRRGLT